MPEPREIAEAIENRAALPDAAKDECFSGYVIIGLPFASGHVLALRRFPASSIGPGYTSVWHRDPQERWTFYQSVSPNMSCSRYFGRLIHENVWQDIHIDWLGPRSFSIRSEGEKSLQWDIKVTPTTATRFLNGLGRLMPAAWWQNSQVLSLMGGVAGVTLRAGKIRLAGRVPNGQTFMANPQLIWLVSESRAVVNGEDLGPIGPLAEQAHIGEFLIPQRGIFAVARSYLESFDSARHASATTSDQTV